MSVSDQTCDETLTPTEEVTSDMMKTEVSEKKEEVTKLTVGKVEVLLKSAGDAPILKKKKFVLESNKTICYVINFLRKAIKCGPEESLFVYVNQTFAPSPDTEVGTLNDCFGTEGKLILHYCKTQAWG